jgi:hypothetical protein
MNEFKEKLQHMTQREVISLFDRVYIVKCRSIILMIIAWLVPFLIAYAFKQSALFWPMMLLALIIDYIMTPKIIVDKRLVILPCLIPEDLEEIQRNIKTFLDNQIKMRKDMEMISMMNQGIPDQFKIPKKPNGEK